MKDEHDTSTIDHAAAPMVYGHYNPVAPNQYYKVSGNRYAGSKTPDVIRGRWSTPKDLIAWLVSRYGEYQLDAAAEEENKVCDKFFSEKTNCLTRWWGKGRHIWLNPPYDNIDPFVQKAIEQTQDGNQIDILLPADNSTAWFKEISDAAHEIIWITAAIEGNYTRSGRLAFVNAGSGKPVDNNNKGSVLFILKEKPEGQQAITNYVPITECCPDSSSKKRAKLRHKL